MNAPTTSHPGEDGIPNDEAPHGDAPQVPHAPHAPHVPPGAPTRPFDDPLRILRELARRVAVRPERRVLVLQGERASWTSWRGGRCVDEWSGASSGRPLGSLADGLGACPWPATNEVLVDVVADSPHDEIERVLVASAAAIGSGPVGWLRRALLRSRLARRHPAAVVRMAPPETAPLVAVLLRAELPDDWRRALETLQRGPFTVRALHPAIALRNATGEGGDGDLLRVVRAAGTERHVLYRSGCPTFTRVVDAAGAEEARAALDETLAHLAAHHGIVAPRVSRADAPDDARRLARDALGTRARRQARRQVQRRADASEPLLDKWRSHLTLRRLQASTTLTALIAVATFAVAAANGLDSARQRARAVAAGEALLVRVDALATSAAERHASPALAAASLAVVDARERAAAPDAGGVLGLLAEVLTAHPEVRLERLAWSLRAPGSDDTDASFTRAASLPVASADLDEEAAPGDVLLEIAGRIDATASRGDASGDVSGDVSGEGAARSLPVGERQSRFEAFADALRRRAGVTSLVVRLSPATAASRGDGARDAPPLDYELRLRYARSG